MSGGEGTDILSGDDGNDFLLFESGILATAVTRDGETITLTTEGGGQLVLTSIETFQRGTYGDRLTADQFYDFWHDLIS